MRGLTWIVVLGFVLAACEAIHDGTVLTLWRWTF
jgi:hypothetical protein